jgi:RNA polymerase sigma-70 factor (family 1)
MWQNEQIKNERSLLEQIAAGDQRSFTAIFNHYSKLIYPFALKLTRSQDLAEEILQEVFLKIWVHRSTLSGVENFGAYLNRITRNHCYNVIRRLAHEALVSSELANAMTEEVHSTEDDVIGWDLEQSLNNAINQLTPQQKLVYTMCHQDGLKYEEVASRLNLSRSTIHTHMKLALRLIRKYLIQINTLLF